jgi:hypothetical protein
MEALGGERTYSSYSFTTSALDGSEWLASRPGRAFTPGERTPGTHCTGGWVWTQRLEKTSFRPCRGSNPDRPVVQPVVRHYTAWANYTLGKLQQISTSGVQRLNSEPAFLSAYYNSDFMFPVRYPVMYFKRLLFIPDGFTLLRVSSVTELILTLLHSFLFKPAAKHSPWHKSTYLLYRRSQHNKWWW